MLTGSDRVSQIERRIALCIRLGSANIADESEFTGATRSSVKGWARKLPLSSLQEETSSPPCAQSRRRIERRGRSCHSLGSAYYAIGTSHHEKRSKVALRAAVVSFTVLATVWHMSWPSRQFIKCSAKSSHMIHCIASRFCRASAIILWCIWRRSFLGEKKIRLVTFFFYTLKSFNLGSEMMK